MATTENDRERKVRARARSSIQDVTISQAPFSGTFSPLQPNSVFAGDTANGTWILHVTDSALLDTSNVRAFSVDLTGFSCAP